MPMKYKQAKISRPRQAKKTAYIMPSADMMCGRPASYAHTSLTYFEFQLKVQF